MHLTRFRILALSALLAALAVPGAAHAGCLPDTIVDNSYDGSLGSPSMLCCPYTVDPGFPGQITDVNVSLAIDHNFVGDLVIKLQSPNLTVSTILSRPGLAEGTDNGTGDGGDGSDWAGASILFDEQASAVSAETMGSTIGATGKICTDDGICAYKPAHGSGAGSRLDTDFDGETHVGTWTLCVGDASADVGHATGGTWNSYDLQLTIDRSIPCVCAGKFRGGDRVRYAPIIGPTGSSASGSNLASLSPEGFGPPPPGAAGEVMCGSLVGAPILVAWDNYSLGYDGDNDCDCPTGDLGISAAGWKMPCNELLPDLPWLDDFETGNTNHWSSSVG